MALNAIPDADLMATFWAMLRCGLTVCPVNPRWPPAVTDEALKMAAIDGRFDSSLVADKSDGLANDTASAANSAQIWASPATIIFSSGSSRAPKAIAHELSAHLASADGANRNLPLVEGDSWLLSLPLFHVSGLGILFRCTLAGATVIVPQPDQSLWDQIHQFRPTHLSLVPTQLIRLLDRSEAPPEGLRGVLLGGAPLPADLIARAHRAGWPLATTYGLSEMASQVTATRVGASEEELHTAGYVLAHRQIKIDDEQQIWVRGATLFHGYVQGASISRPTDAEGWYGTGDLGRWDSQGRLIVIGRRDHLFISGGENIYPEEIERALLDLPGVYQAIVVPVADREFGQIPVAFVDGDHKQVTSWRRALADHLPKFKIPARYYPWPEQEGLKANRRKLQQLADPDL